MGSGWRTRSRRAARIIFSATRRGTRIGDRSRSARGATRPAHRRGAPVRRHRTLRRASGRRIRRRCSPSCSIRRSTPPTGAPSRPSAPLWSPARSVAATVLARAPTPSRYSPASRAPLGSATLTCRPRSPRCRAPLSRSSRRPSACPAPGVRVRRPVAYRPPVAETRVVSVAHPLRTDVRAPAPGRCWLRPSVHGSDSLTSETRSP